MFHYTNNHGVFNLYVIFEFVNIPNIPLIRGFGS